MNRVTATPPATIATLGSALICSAASTALADARLTPLGDLPGGSFDSRATAVSGDGAVVVGYSDSASGVEAFRWTRAGGMVGLGTLPGQTFSLAYGVSGDGSVVAGYGGNSPSASEAFRWTSGGGMVALPLRTAFGVSSDGSVIVGTALDLQAARWTSGGGAVGLGFGDAYGISGDGSVVVGTSSQQAFRWTGGGGMVGLGGDLPPGFPTGGPSDAYGVSGDGSVVVGALYGEHGYGQAFRWTSGGGTVVGYLPDGHESYAAGVSGDGSAVVGYGHITRGDAGLLEAFRWTGGTRMDRLWDVLLANGVDPATDGWTRLFAAYGISADGDTIVGIGGRNGNVEAFVAVIPEPAALPLMLLGGRALLRRRRRCL